MRKKAIILGMTLVMVLAGCAKKEEAPEEIAPRSIEVITVAKGRVQSEMAYSGRVKGIKEVNVMSSSSAKVAASYYKVGDTVQEGAVLFQLDTVDIENNLKSLRASLASADASVASAKTTLDTVNGAAMQTQIETSKAALANASLAYDNAKTTYENSKVLFESNIISQAELDKAQMAFDSAQISYDQAKATNEIVTKKMPAENEKKARDGYNVAVAGRNSVAAQMANAEKMLRDAAVKSPISGVVAANNTVVGELISPAQLGFTIVDLSQVEIVVGVSEQIVNTIQGGDTANVLLSAVSDTPISGTIKTVSPMIGQKGTYEVRVQVDNADGRIKSGMLGDVYFVKDVANDSIVIPRECVITKDKEDFVYIEENGIAKKITVTLGIDTGKDVEIKSGLKEGMRLVSKGQTYISDGDPVEIYVPKTEAEKSTSSKETDSSKKDVKED